MADLDPDAPVLLVGTGLTMVDVVISLLDQKHRGQIYAISRRGLLPRTHTAAPPHVRFLTAATAPRNILALLRTVRREIEHASANGRNWRSVIDALRPDTQDLWRGLPLNEKRRFMRHLRPWWDVHRHRMAPNVAVRIGSAIDRGQLTVQRARLGRLAQRSDHVEVELLPAGGAPSVELHVGRVINCSGPISDVSQIEATLIRKLLDSGHARPDALNLGLDVTSDGAVIDGSGCASVRLFAVGPITKGAFWETTAVPDIRVQCERLADHILELHPPQRIVDLRRPSGFA
jgi:uncharacterized NAD(P)/FAD-binding protein YdhS